MAKKLQCLMAASVIGLSFNMLGPASAQEAFYQGETIRLIVSQSPGGGFDTYSRTIARHMFKHIPGKPTIIVQNMPGAGNLIATNYLYNIAKPDGLTMGNFVGGVVLEQLLGRRGVEFDARKFEWIGVPIRYHPVCVISKASGVTNVDKWLSSKVLIKLGGTGPGSTTDQIPKILKAALGLPIRVVSGYKGTSDIRLAVESGEIEGACFAWQSIKVTWRKALDAGDASVVLQVMAQAHPDLSNIPLAGNFAKTSEARNLLQAGVQNPASITLPYSLPPGTSKERVRELRRAFLETLRDKEFLAEAKKTKLEIDPIAGDEVERIVKGLFELEPTLVTKLREILYQ